MNRPIIFVNDNNTLSLYVGNKNENGNLLGEVKKTDNDFIFINNYDVSHYTNSDKFDLGKWDSSKFNGYMGLIGFGPDEPVNVCPPGFAFRHDVLKMLGIDKHTTIKKDCRVCEYQIWAIALGAGVFCSNDKNKETNLGYGVMNRGYPYIPTNEFMCDHFKLKAPSHHIIQK